MRLHPEDAPKRSFAGSRTPGTSFPFRKEWRTLAFSLVVLLLYGGALGTLLHDEPGVSWSAHVSGFIAGMLAAWWTRRMR